MHWVRPLALPLGELAAKPTERDLALPLGEVAEHSEAIINKYACQWQAYIKISEDGEGNYDHSQR